MNDGLLGMVSSSYFTGNFVGTLIAGHLMYKGTLINRGKLLTAYMMVYYLGTVVGQLLIGVISTQLLSVIPWVFVLVISAMLPLLLRLSQANLVRQGKLRFGQCLNVVAYI